MSSSPKVTPMTTETTSTTSQAPTFQSGTSSTTTQNKIPAWLEGTSQSMLSRANKLSKTPYQSYGGERVAGFDPMMQEAFSRIGAQGVAGQIGDASGIAGLAAQKAMEAGELAPYETGRFTGETAQQYRDPYIQNVVNTQLREAQREADIAATTRAGAATRAGAYGGSRQAIMDAEAQRNLAMQKGDIQAAGLQKAFESGRTQFNVEDALREQSRQFGANIGLQGASQALGAAQALEGLGQTQFQQEMDITQGLGYAGSLKQQQAQAGLDVAYQDFLAKQKYPYEQLSWLQGITAGAPHSTTQISNTRTSGVTTPGAQTTTGTSVQTPTSSKPSAVSQGVGVTTALYGMSELAEGGLVGYADGGITGLLSDQQLQQRQQNQNLPTIARLAAEVEAKERAGIRQGAQPQAPQGARPTVAAEVMAGLGALEDEVPDDVVGYADGGIMGYAKGGDLEEDEPSYVPFYEQAYRQGEEKGSIYDPNFGLPAAERASRAEAARPREIVVPAAEVELTRLQNPDAAVRAEGEGSFWKGLGAALMRNDDVEAAKARAANQTLAETERLKRAALYTEPAAPVASTPSPGVGKALPNQRRQGAQPVPDAMPKGGLGDTPEATAPGAVPALATAQPAAPQGIDAQIQKYTDAMKAGAQQQADLAKEEADAIAKMEADRLARFETRQKESEKGDEGARSRISERKSELDAQRKQARAFAIVRAGLAMMSGESPYALVNIGRGAQEGLNQFAADTQKIDEAKEGLRKELDRLDQIRREAQAASAEKREQLLVEYDKAKVNATFAGRKVLVASGIEANKAIATAFVDGAIKQHFSLQDKAVEHQYRIGEIREQGRQTRASSTAAAKLSPVLKEQIDGVDAQIRATNDQIKTLMDSRRPRTQETIAALNRQLQALQAQRNQLLGVQSTAPAGGSRIKFDAQGNPI